MILYVNIMPVWVEYGSPTKMWLIIWRYSKNRGKFMDK
jgi:hypothetical protein